MCFQKCVFKFSGFTGFDFKHLIFNKFIKSSLNGCHNRSQRFDLNGKNPEI